MCRVLQHVQASGSAPPTKRSSAGERKPRQRARGPYSSAVSAARQSPAMLSGRATSYCSARQHGRRGVIALTRWGALRVCSSWRLACGQVHARMAAGMVWVCTCLVIRVPDAIQPALQLADRHVRPECMQARTVSSKGWPRRWPETCTGLHSCVTHSRAGRVAGATLTPRNRRYVSLQNSGLCSMPMPAYAPASTHAACAAARHQPCGYWRRAGSCTCTQAAAHQRRRSAPPSGRVRQAAGRPRAQLTPAPLLRH